MKTTRTHPPKHPTLAMTLLLALGACIEEPSSDESIFQEQSRDLDEAVSALAEERISSIQEEAEGARGASLQQLCEQEFKFEHFIDVGDGVRIHVIERFSGRAVLQSPRRAVLMLPPTLAANHWFDADVPGDSSYNALHQLASRGYFGFAMSYEGFGESTRPADGSTVTAERILGQAATVLEWIRYQRGVSKVDVFGTSIGAGIAIALGGVDNPINHHHVRNLVISTTVYEVFNPEVAASYSPAFEAFLLGQPGGYLTTTPASYAGAFAGMDPAALAWANASIPGEYPIGPTLEIFNLPFFEGESGRAPLIQFWGDANPLTPLADPQQLEEEYGGPYELVIYEGAGHSPMTEPVRHLFWDDVEAFLDSGSHARSLCDY